MTIQHYRAMLLFKLAEGRRFIAKQNNATAPPSGYNSVYGRHGQSLNYDEIVMCDPDAALPTHIYADLLIGWHTQDCTLEYCMHVVRMHAHTHTQTHICKCTKI